MGFRIYSTNDGHVPAWEYPDIDATGINPEVGLALTVDGGAYSVCPAAEVPDFICMADPDKNPETIEDEYIPVIRVNSDIVFGVPCSEAYDAVKFGDEVTINEGKEVTATTGGKAIVVGYKDTEVGSEIRVRFDRV